jgi:hypothetical protein
MLHRNRFGFIATSTGGGGGVDLPLSDVDILLADDADATKQARFELSSISTGTTRTYTLPNSNGTLSLEGHTHSISNVTDLQTTLDGKASTSHSHSYSLTNVEHFDDFVNTVVRTSATTVTSADAWYRSVSGTGAIVTYDQVDSGVTATKTDPAHGVALFDTGTATGRANIGNAPFRMYGTWTNYSVVTYEARFLLKQLSDDTNRFTVGFGFANTINGTGSTKQVSLLYTDNVNSGQLVIRLRNDGSVTDFNTTHSALAANTWYKLKIEIDWGTHVKVWLDGNLIGTQTTMTNEPAPATSDVLLPRAIIEQSAGTTSCKMYVDYIYLNYTFGTART